MDGHIKILGLKEVLILKAPMGFSLMQILKLPENNEIIEYYRNNILATCGGNMSCSTCVVKIDENYINKISPMGEDEWMFLDIFLDQYNLSDPLNQYRLSCQIIMDESINGLTITFAN